MREKSGPHGNRLGAQLMEAANLLASDTPLLRRHFDHPLSGRVPHQAGPPSHLPQAK